MSTVATLWVKLGLDSSGYTAGLASAESKTSSFASTASQKLKTVGASMMKTGVIATAGLTVPIVVGMGKAVGAASDLEESINAVNVVFGNASDTVLAFGENSATAVGLSNSAFNSMATITGALLQNLGFDEDQAAESTINLATRAADMASVFNTDVDQALGAVNSALKGEFNPLEQFGVKLNAADISARAMSLGLADAEGNLDNNAKAQAALSLIMEQTDKISGDFQNTSDGLANSQRILGAQVSDLGADIGKKLLPFVTDLVQWISELVTWFGNLSPETQTVILVVLGLVAAIGPLLLIFGALATAIGAVLPIITAVVAFFSGPVLAIIAAVIAIVALLAAAWKNDFGGMRTTIMNLWNNAVKPFAESVIAWFQQTIPAAIERLTEFWQGVLLPALQNVWAWIDQNLMPLFEALGELLSVTVSKAVEGLGVLWGQVLLPAIEKVWDFIKNTLMPLLEQTLGPKLEWLSNKILPALKKAFDAISKVIETVIGWVMKLAAAIAGIDFGDLTPGSPTPFEIGLLGIATALKKVNRIGLDPLDTGLPEDVSTTTTVSGIATPDPPESSQFQNEQIDYERLAEVVAFTVAKEMG